MNAYRVTLTLFEKGEYEDDGHTNTGDTKKIVTVAASLAKASAFAKEAWEKADGTDQKEFYWEPTDAELIEGIVALPALKAVIPRT